MSSIPISRTPDTTAGTQTLSATDVARAVFKALGSLKLAVGCFAVSIVLILIGTLAQVGKDIWEVLGIYFYTWFTYVEATVLIPRSWYPQLTTDVASRLLAVGVTGASWLTLALVWLNTQSRLGRGIAVGLVVWALYVATSALNYGGFWFPGGATIGAVMCLNLLAAHLTRYTIRAKGARFIWGLGVAIFGLLVTWLVIATGHNSDGFQGQPPFAWSTLWQVVKAGLTLGGVALTAYALFGKSSRQFVRPLSAVAGIPLLLLSVWLWVTGDASYLGDSGMRVLWQLIMASVAGVVLLTAAVLLFGQRGGVIVLHLGIGLLMFGQWFVSQYDVEEQMMFAEGQELNYGQDIRSVELAVIRRDSPEFPGKDDVIAIPMIQNGRETRFVRQDPINDELLPFEIEIVDFRKSSTVAMPSGDSQSPANAGDNQDFAIAEARPASGATGDSVDLASGYFRFRDKQTGESLGTYLLSQESLRMRGGRIRNFDTETVSVKGVDYDVQLRFKRNYKNYTIQLIEVRKDDYLGTDIPRNYSSRIHLEDPTRQIDQELTIWMNNPRRYAGQTFYQSGYQEDQQGNKYSTLQVVRNRGWMIPYVACMICAVGMGYHFFNVLLRFLDRKQRQVGASAGSNADASSPYEMPATAETGPQQPKRAWLVPTIVIVLFCALLAKVATRPTPAPDQMNLTRFGEVPLVYQGRVKPFDTLARNTLRIISEAETFKGVLPPDQLAEAWPQFTKQLKDEYPALKDQDLSKYKTGDTRGLIALITEETQTDVYNATRFVEDQLFTRQPAIRWLMDVISGHENSRRHKVIRIYHPQVLDTLGLKRRKYYRYSLEEIAPRMSEFEEQVRQAREKDAAELSLYQKKILDLDVKIRRVLLLHRAFSPPEFPPLPSGQDSREQFMQKISQFRDAMIQQQRMFEAMKPPLAVPPTEESEDGQWQAYAGAWPMQILKVQVLGEEPEPTFRALNEILLAYLDNDAQQFNSAVDRYHRLLESSPPTELQTKPSVIGDLIEGQFGSFYAFESYFNHFAPFFVCSGLYLLAFVMLCVSWLVWRVALTRAAFWLILLTFVVHTGALIARIYISGRPPVTNLYSSAVFIGWGVVLLSLVIEALYRNGLASLAASGSGFATLLIAHKLAGDGDTFEVLQAVLDTQFWLATHVVCITFGYATTFLAGGLGLIYIVRGLFTPSLTRGIGSDLARMIYGTLCFAIFFSFVGTVLGGLWADDSWGRFWGWDPKENGALIIVLWNALILHARWDRMIRDRGLAVLALAGNIVTAWSWFGVNELGVGLHSYGFTEGRLRALGLTVLAHLVVVILGCLPVSWWWSYRKRSSTAS